MRCKTSILLLAVIAVLATTVHAQTTKTNVSLSWAPYTPQTTQAALYDNLGYPSSFFTQTNYPDAFVLRYSPIANAPLFNWQILSSFSVLQTNGVQVWVRTNWYATNVPLGNAFFTLSASNSTGEAFSNVPLRWAPSAGPQLLNAHPAP